MFSGAPSRPEAVRPVNFNSGAIGDGSGNGEGGGGGDIFRAVRDRYSFP